MILRGRRDECAALDELLARVRRGRSAVLVLRGEAGIGKTVLLEHAAEQAAAGDVRVARCVGVQGEMELAFAGLHQLCGGLLDDGLAALPAPQQQALAVAFGLQQGVTPNRFLVALATLSLLAEAAEVAPLVCLFDDAQWLDSASAQVLAFVARRLLAERIGMVFAVRDQGGADLAGLPELRVEGLADADALALLQGAVVGPVDAPVRDRILAETRGNPLALLELPRGLAPAELAGGFGLPDARPLAGRIEQTFHARVAGLPAATQTLLLLAAAEPLGDAALLWRAAEALGVGTEAAWPAETADLIELGARVRFLHPLVRSAVYRAASASARRNVHAALAAATDPELDPDRRAWHRASAATDPDAEVADELASSAARARGRGGLAAAAAFLQRAAELTPPEAGGGARVDRALDPAQAKHDVADAAAAADLLAVAEHGVVVDDLHRARVERLGAQIAFARWRGREAAPLLLAAARRLDALDTGMARETYLEGLAAAMFAGRLGDGPDEAEIARAVVDGVAPELGAADALLNGLVARFTGGYAAGVEPLREALRAFDADGGSDAERRWLWLACRMAQDLWDDELWHDLATRGVQLARDTGALNLLPAMANYLAAYRVHSGAFAAATGLADEVDALTAATGVPPLKYGAYMVVTAQGDDEAAARMFRFGFANATERGEGSALGIATGMLAVMHNGAGRHDEALLAAREVCEHKDVIAYGWALAELTEAATRCGRREEAGAALARLEERTRAAGTPWALGVAARCAALVTGEEGKYLESIALLERSRAALELARARLGYGEWLRAAGPGRRAEAREQLRAAHADFTRFGAAAFADRARRELLATGASVAATAAAADDARPVLTAQEAQVARLARAGHTNPEIGSQLYISPRTVEYHLHKVYRKLDVASRGELRDALPCG
jgi:DNA-binding CsgD family transcriptional regulator